MAIKSNLNYNWRHVYNYNFGEKTYLLTKLIWGYMWNDLVDCLVALIYLKKILFFWYLNKPFKNKLLNNLHWSSFDFNVFHVFVNNYFVRVTECWRWTFYYIEINNLKLEVCQIFTGNRMPWDEFHMNLMSVFFRQLKSALYFVIPTMKKLI